MKRAQSKESVFSTCTDAQSSASFTIGETVKADERIGRVAFVGRTEFHSGEWVGLILEKPQGKNNGTVNGIKYFECKENHGVFCRPHKLVKIRPIAMTGSRAQAAPAVSVAGGARSPTNSVYSVAFSVAASQAGGSREHSPYAAQYGYDIGDRVVTDDGRAGKVKFLNLVTDQIIAGIVLDRPLGDSDGKYQAIQYFKCYPKYATFLPAQQLKKAATTIASSALPPKKTPRPTKASQLRTEKGGIGSVAGFKGSRESLDSLMRSPPPNSNPTASNLKRSPNGIKDSDFIAGLKKCVQEKEAHLAKLSIELSERSNDADRLAQENLSLKLRISELDAELTEVQHQLAVKYQEMQRGIDERDKRLDDLSFCFTEAELKKEELELRMKQLANAAMPTLHEEEMANPEMASIGLQTDQLEQVAASSQTDGLEKPETATLGLQTDQLKQITATVQTDSVQNNELVTVGLQTDRLEQVTTTVQTDSALLASAMPSVFEQVAASSQTDGLEKPETATLGLQTDQHEQVVASSQTDGLEKPETATLGLQTDQHEQVAASSQTDGLEKPETATLGLQTDQLKQSAATVQTDDVQTNELATVGLQTDQLEQVTTTVQTDSTLAPAIPSITTAIQTDNDVPVVAALLNRTRTTTRTYCEHCELFDAHDSSECPKEEARLAERRCHEAISPRKNEREAGRLRATKRIYCDYCELFDAHDSSDCPKEEARRAERCFHDTVSAQKMDERERMFWRQ